MVTFRGVPLSGGKSCAVHACNLSKIRTGMKTHRNQSLLFSVLFSILHMISSKLTLRKFGS